MQEKREAINVLCSNYAYLLEGDYNTRLLPGNHVNSRNYGVSALSEGDSYSFVLKEEKVTDARRYEEKTAKLHFYKRLCPKSELLPGIMETEKGDVFVFKDDRLYSLHEFRQGNPYNSTKQSIVNAAKGLARLHKLLGRSKGAFQRPRCYRSLSECEIEKSIHKVTEKRNKSSFEVRILEFLRGPLREHYEDISGSIGGLGLPGTLVHFDFHPGNAIFCGNRLEAILDYDSLMNEFRMQAVAFAASRFCAPFNPWPFLAAYSEVDPLQRKELVLYPLFVRREAIKRINYLIRLNVLKQRDLWQGELSKHLFWIEKSRQLESQIDVKKKTKKMLRH